MVKAKRAPDETTAKAAAAIEALGVKYGLVSSLLLLALLAAAPDAGHVRAKFSYKPLSLAVPGALNVVPVPERQQALGVPIDLVSVRSKEKLPALITHFRRHFAEAGLFVPDEDELPFPSPIPHVTGLDVVSNVSYSVMFQENQDGTVTAIIGTAYLHARKANAEPPVTELPPGATSILTANVVEAKSTSFRTALAPDKVLEFFRASMKKRGLTETSSGHFEGKGGAYDVWIRPTETDTAVVVIRVAPRAAP